MGTRKDGSKEDENRNLKSHIITAEDMPPIPGKLNVRNRGNYFSEKRSRPRSLVLLKPIKTFSKIELIFHDTSKC